MASKILMAACVVWWFVTATAAIAQAACDEWNTQAFFEKAAASDVTRCLEEFGGGPKARDEDGYTPLHWAARSSKIPSVVAALLDAGADLKARGKFGWTPLHLAAAYSKTSSVVAALLDAGADPKAKDAVGRIPWDLISHDSTLKGTDAYWRLNEARFE